MDIPKFLYHYYEKEQGPFLNITGNTLALHIQIVWCHFSFTMNRNCLCIKKNVAERYL